MTVDCDDRVPGLTPDRSVEDTLAAWRKAIADGNDGAWLGLGNALAAQPGSEEQAERAYREAIAAGHPSGWLGVGNVLLMYRGREKEAEAAYRKTIESVDRPAERDSARQGEALARQARLLRRTKVALAALAAAAFLVNFIFKADRSGAWTVLDDVVGLAFWFAFLTLPVALVRERSKIGGVLRTRRERRRARRTGRRAGTRRPIRGRDRASRSVDGLRRLGERRRRLEARLERLFPSLYDARHAAKGVGRVAWPLIGPLLMALVLLVLAAVAHALGLRAPAIDLPSIEFPSVDLPEWLRTIGEFIAVLLKYLIPAVIVIYGIRQSIAVRRTRTAAERLGRAQLLRRLAIALKNVEATARARGASTDRVGNVARRRHEKQ